MTHRLYLPPPVDIDRPVVLDGDRSHYLTRVLRLRRGAELVCFDGAGRSWNATLTAATSRSATLELGALLSDEPAPQPGLHLAQGLLKGSAMDMVMQKSTELGATNLWPVRAARSNVPGAADRLARKATHWQRVIESAAEQCGAVHLPRLHEITDFDDFLAAVPPVRWLLLDPGAPVLPLDLPAEPTGVLIGPEGGWNDAERRAAEDRGFARVGLGSRILRGETAPLAVLAALRHGWGWR